MRNLAGETLLNIISNDAVRFGTGMVREPMPRFASLMRFGHIERADHGRLVAGEGL